MASERAGAGDDGPLRAGVETAVRPTAPGVRLAAERWAARLGLPLREPGGQDGGAAVTLEVGSDGLALRAEGGPAVRVSLGQVLSRPAGGRDLLLRAVGALPEGACVADATAGLGADAVRLAARGYRVTMIERVPLIAALLEDALERARRGDEGEAARAAAGRVRLVVGDARQLLRTLDPPPAVVVIDPMYPLAGKRGRPKKGMALFRSLVGADADAPGLLAAALRVATGRVVVKRPRRGARLGAPAGAPAPSGSVMGTTSRYDIYAPSRRGT